MTSSKTEGVTAPASLEPKNHGAFPVPIRLTGLDNCQFCLGAKGGVPGNENNYNGVVVCDYCSVLLGRAQKTKDDSHGQ